MSRTGPQVQTGSDGQRVPIKMWTRGVQVEDAAMQQLHNVAAMPFIHKHVAVMPDMHWGLGATIGSVIPTKDVIIPAAVGVDLGCGMMATRTTIKADQLPDNLLGVRTAIEAAIPHGRTDNGGAADVGSWKNDPPSDALHAWRELAGDFARMVIDHPALQQCNNVNHLGTLGTGNHFVEVCLDEQQHVWVMLHSGSRGVGNRIGTYFIRKAKEEMKRWHIHLPDVDLAYLPEGTQHFGDYVRAVHWAQRFALRNRELMMERALDALFDAIALPLARGTVEAVNCHHNYVNRERHFGATVWVTRKGAVSARRDELGIIPGSMGAKSFIVRGKGNRESFHSCSHGAGRAMSRREAKRRFTVEHHAKATEGVECRKDEGVLDETPAAYKDIDAVMAAQVDLVDVVHTLRQVVCVKG